MIRVRRSSEPPELMQIGHSNQSMTFMPNVEQGDDFVYIDCPGFLDNRGSELNIANACNIKQALQSARSVKVLVLLNYYSLKADRGRGLTDLVWILEHLFGCAEVYVVVCDLSNDKIDSGHCEACPFYLTGSDPLSSSRCRSRVQAVGGGRYPK